MNEEFERLKKTLIEEGKLGRISGKVVKNFNDITENDGVTRPSGSVKDKETRDYFLELLKSYGLDIFIDKFGNIFGTLKGNSDEYIFVGSHLDSVIEGGMFDGAMGVFGGLEAIKRIKDSGYKNKKNITIVAFTGEEGSSFHIPMLGSHAFAHIITDEEIKNVKNREGKTLFEAMDGIKYNGKEEFHGKPKYYIEFHIEQGPILEAENKQIGVVDSITGQVVIDVNFTGIQGHSGTTPMYMRKNAYIPAAELALYVDKIAREAEAKYKKHSVGTVGEIYVKPNRFNVIPGYVEIKIDLRSPDNDSLLYMKENVLIKLKELNGKISVKYSIVSEVKPTILSKDVIKIIEKSTKDNKFSYKIMPSGAGHDTIPISRICKAGMIFVPSKNGISHSPFEWTDFREIESGVRILVDSIMKLDNIE